MPNLQSRTLKPAYHRRVLVFLELAFFRPSYYNISEGCRSSDKGLKLSKLVILFIACRAYQCPAFLHVVPSKGKPVTIPNYFKDWQDREEAKKAKAAMEFQIPVFRVRIANGTSEVDAMFCYQEDNWYCIGPDLNFLRRPDPGYYSRLLFIRKTYKDIYLQMHFHSNTHLEYHAQQQIFYF